MTQEEEIREALNRHWRGELTEKSVTEIITISTDGTPVGDPDSNAFQRETVLQEDD